MSNFSGPVHSLVTRGNTCRRCGETWPCDVTELRVGYAVALEALKASFQVLSGHHEAIGHDYEPDATTGPCVGCDAIVQARAAIEAAKGNNATP